MRRKAFPRRESGFNKEVKGNSSEQMWQLYELQGKGSMDDSHGLESVLDPVSDTSWMWGYKESKLYEKPPKGL